MLIYSSSNPYSSIPSTANISVFFTLILCASILLFLMMWCAHFELVWYAHLKWCVYCDFVRAHSIRCAVHTLFV